MKVYRSTVHCHDMMDGPPSATVVSAFGDIRVCGLYEWRRLCGERSRKH